jgi:hypothetical protein
MLKSTLVVAGMLAFSSMAYAGMPDPATGEANAAAHEQAKQRATHQDSSSDRQDSAADRQHMRSGLENMMGARSSGGTSRSAASTYMARSGGHVGLRR